MSSRLFPTLQWKDALDALISSREAESREIIAACDRRFALLRSSAHAAARDGQDELAAQAVASLRKLRNEDTDELQDRLMAVESSTVDHVSELVGEFDRRVFDRCSNPCSVESPCHSAEEFLATVACSLPSRCVRVSHRTRATRAP